MVNCTDTMASGVMSGIVATAYPARKKATNKHECCVRPAWGKSTRQPRHGVGKSNIRRGFMEGEMARTSETVRRVKKKGDAGVGKSN